MLVLSRKNDQAVVIQGSHHHEDTVVVTVIAIRAGRVILGFETQENVSVLRQELFERKLGGGKREAAGFGRRKPMGETSIEGVDHAWFALADAERCRLLCCRSTKQGTRHVDEVDAIENKFPERERLRAQTGDGMSHDVEEKERRFAGKIVARLQESAKAHEFHRLAIFAPPRMIGIIRKASFGLLAGHLAELEGNLMGLQAGQLAEHPMIRDLMRAAHEA